MYCSAALLQHKKAVSQNIASETWHSFHSLMPEIKLIKSRKRNFYMKATKIMTDENNRRQGRPEIKVKVFDFFNFCLT